VAGSRGGGCRGDRRFVGAGDRGDGKAGGDAGLLLCLPLFAVGFSYPGTENVAGFAVDILAGTVWSVLVALAWPQLEGSEASPAPMPPASLIVRMAGRPV
jgi:hypothetical protein